MGTPKLLLFFLAVLTSTCLQARPSFYVGSGLTSIAGGDQSYALASSYHLTGALGFNTDGGGGTMLEVSAFRFEREDRVDCGEACTLDIKPEVRGGDVEILAGFLNFRMAASAGDTQLYGLVGVGPAWVKREQGLFVHGQVPGVSLPVQPAFSEESYFAAAGKVGLGVELFADKWLGLWLQAELVAFQPTNRKKESFQLRPLTLGLRF